MAAILVENLQSLHSVYQQSKAAGRDQIDGSISDITQICIYEVSEKDKDFFCSALFDKETGIVTFIQKIVGEDEFQSSKAALLDLIAQFALLVEKKIVPYALDIKEVCMSAFTRDRSAKVKNAAVTALVKVLRLTVGSQMGDDLKIDKMVNKFFMELTKASKLVPTVKGNIYTLLGVMAEVYPEYVTVYSERLASLYVSALKAEMTSKTKKPELPIIAGCLEGLTAFLINFTQSAEEDSKHSEDIFMYARKAIDPSVDFTRYDVPKSGLELFARHASQFKQFLADDYMSMYEKLQKWSHHHNREVVHLGVAALEAFLKQISETITERALEGNKEGAIFKYFLQEFRNTMGNAAATSKEVSMAVKGYGLLAAPCRIFLTAADVQFMFSEMVTKCEQEFLSSQFVDEKLLSLPGYLHALANIIKEVSEVSETYALTLERLLVVQVENLPKVHKPSHFISLKAVLHLLLILQAKGGTFNKVLTGFVYQSLIRTCSHPVATETEEQEADAPGETELNVRRVTYKDFLELWGGLLESAKVKDLVKEGIGLEERDQFTKALYDELMTAVLRVIGKLDFTAISKGGEEDETEAGGSGGDKENLSADPVSGVEANRPMDFQVFINLVDFCRDLLVTKQFVLFEKWVFTFTHTIIVQSTQFPLVSGFYKLLAVSMKIASKLKYFQACGVAPAAGSEAMEVEEEEDRGGESQTQKFNTFLLITKFSKEVLVRMKQYRDDLLASCLTLILALPKEIVAQQMKHVVPAIQLTFSMGLSYLPLAQVGLEALEGWSKTLPADVMETHFPCILPCLDAFLKTADTGAEEVSVDSVVSMSGSKSSRRRKKLTIRKVRNQKPADAEKSYESQLSVVKRRIVAYLGSLGGSVNHAMLAGSEEEISRRAITWDTNQHLRFDMPFFDMKPVIYFDPFLPHVVELARQSSDRQTKVAACELLHSLTLYTVGRSAQQPGERQKRYPMEQLYSKLFPPLLALACDVEQVCRQLFEPLVMQLIHWFTGTNKGESPESMALLNAIFDGLVQQEDTMLRDFCARCLREFLYWSIKQTTKKALEKNPGNVKSILKRMYSYALHPSAFKRLGAAFAFNSIYAVLREEDSLVDRFTFQILVHFVESLAMAHADEKSLGTQDQCKKALEHLEKIIRAKADLLRKESKVRTEPVEWSKRVLDIAVRWLTRQCGRPQTECRHACMKLVYQLAPCIQGISAPVDYFQAFLKGKEAGAYFVARFEGGGQAVAGKKGLSSCPTMDLMATAFSLHSVLAWFDMLLAALDCYCWVFGEGLLPPDKVFADYQEKSSQVFDSVVYFVDKLSLGSLQDAASLFPGKVDTSIFTPKELDDYNRAKCTVIIRLWNFLTILMAKHSKIIAKIVPERLFSKTLWQLCASCVVQPSSVGFNMADVEIIMNLPKEMSQVLMVMSRFLSDAQKKQMLSVLGQELQGNRDVFGQLPLSLTAMMIDYTQLQQTVEGYQQLHRVGLLMPAMGKAAEAPKIARKLFDSVVKGIVKHEGDMPTVVSLNPAAHQVATSLLELAFQLELPCTVLVEGLLDPTPLQGLGQGTRHMLGDHFFTLFKPSVVAHLAVNIDSMVVLMKHAKKHPHSVCSLLVAVLEYVARDRGLRKKQGAAVVQGMLSGWEELEEWWSPGAPGELQALAVHLLTKVMLVDSKMVLDADKPHCTTMVTMYRALLTDRKTNLAFKSRVLDLLPFFAALPKPHDNKLKESLDRFVADNFPLKSSEFTKGTPRHNDYIRAIDKLLSALELSGSLILVELLISVFCREEGRHAHEDAIQEALAAFIQRLPGDKQKDALDISYKIFTSEGSYPNVIRRATVERVCLPMLRLVQKTALIQFFLDHILDLMKTVELKLSRSPASVVETQLTSKLCCFQLLEVMYSRLSREEVNSPSSIINRKVCYGSPETGKEMTQKITKVVNEAKSEDARGETMLVDLRRQYHCYSYNLLVAIITCVQNEAKFYKGFLFQDNVAKGQFLLENIVNKDRKYEFPLEFESRFERKKKFVAIRSEVKEKRAEAGDASSAGSESYHLASQYLTESSLSEDLNKYEFSMSGSAQNTSGSSRSKGSLRKKDSYSAPSDSEVQVRMDGDYVELEMDALNNHECMAPLIALLKHMHRNTIFPPPQPGVPPKEMPSWMSYLCDKVKNPSADLFNVKLFIAKLIINSSEIFQPYAKFWLRPLCQLILSTDLCTDGINYFIVDLVVTMLSWHDHAIPQDSAEEKAMASRLVEFLVHSVYHPTRSILRNNLEMLKTLLTCWKGRIELPYQQVYKQLKMPDPSSKSSLTGIQVLGVILTCKFPPYGPSAPVDRDKYFTTLAASLTSSAKEIYASAAEVVGLVLSYLAEKEGETEGHFHSHIESTLSRVKPDNFIVCVHHMHRHYSPIGKRFLSKLLFMLPGLHGAFRSQCLEVIQGQVDDMANAYMELESKGLLNFLTHRDEDTQLVSLRIVKSLAPRISQKELLSLMPAVTSFTTHPSALCRYTMLDCLMWIYDNYRDSESSDAVEIMKMTKEALLQGLCDEDLHCRLTVQNFWSSNTRLPEGTLDRTVAMLEAMYSPGSERHYLSYATNLLMEMTSKSPDYNRHIFEHPLSECTFKDYSVQSSWRQRHAVMTPLFAVTQMSQSMGSSEDSVDGGQIRATQDAQQFTATMETGSKAPFNWLTQSSLDTFTDYSLSASETPSSLLFNVGSGGQASSSKRPSTSASHTRGSGARDGFGGRMARPTAPAPAAGASKDEENSEEGSDMWRLKRRFIKDQTASSVFFARRQIRLKKMREEALKQQKLRRENQVTLYRKYRIGDLPDIQINYSYIIAPLQALAHRDSTVARLLFSAVFKAIYREMDKVKTEREMEDVRGHVSSSLNHMLSNSTQYYPPFVACVMDIVYSLRSSIKVDSDDLGTAAIVSKLQPLGMEVLEEQLIQQEDGGARSAKRGWHDGTSVSQDVPQWIELARLYKSVGEYDVLQGIFGGMLNTQDITEQAMAKEASGDYKAAKALYEEALEKEWGVKPLDVEVDLWDEGRMECLARMTHWEDLEAVARHGLGAEDSPSLEAVWDDPFYMETYLPYLLRSKVKQMLQGDDGQQSLLSFIDAAMKVPDRKLHLESRYSEELALMYVWQEDYDRARHYASHALQCFLQDWSSTDSLMAASRTTRLQRLQPLVELREFLDFMAHERNFTVSQSRQLSSTWEQRSPHLQLDPVDIWDDIVTNRNVFLDKISERLRSSDSMDTEDKGMFAEEKLDLRLSMARSCQQQNNFNLSLQILKETYSQCRQDSSGYQLVEWSHLYASTHHRKALSAVGTWTEGTVYNVVSTLDQLDKLSETEPLRERPDLTLRQSVLVGEACDTLVTGLMEADLWGSLSAKTAEKLKKYADVTDIDKDKVLNSLVVRGFRSMRQAVSDPQDERLINPVCRQQDLLLALANYCDKYLRLNNDQDESLELNKGDLDEFPSTVVKCMMEAMQNGSAEARERFPRLLQVIENYPDTMALFIKKAESVPSWMFILWISQMMALMDKEQAPAVRPVLLRLANDYPQAVVYPFRISQEGFEFGSSRVDRQNKEGVDKMAALLTGERVPLVSRFISALDQFAQPFQVFKDWADEMRKMLQKGKHSTASLKEKYMEMYRMLMEIPASSDDSSGTQRSQASASVSAPVAMGDFRRRFAEVFKKEFDTAFGKEGQKLVTMKAKEFFGIVRKLQGTFDAQKNTRNLAPPEKLREYCSWMANFSPSRDSRELEIPGQYDGLQKPMPEYHVKIAGFDERVMVMSSIRKPKRITIRGNDERDYHYLVKGGEDLRQDQRIEQLFVIMNRVMEKDAVCRARSLKLKTYQVIPMNPRVGLIEWMNNTLPLKNFLYDAMTDEEKKYIEGPQGPARQHQNWTGKFWKQGKETPGGMYSMVYQKYTKTETEREFRTKEGKVPWDLSRRALMQMSTSPEAFHVLRCAMLTSHAVVCICQYLLGIGDRHLSNFMINLKTGHMVGIDFGHAFGTATQFLPVPELMAIRLTRQIVNVGLPLKVKGMLENTMVHVLRALRQNHDLLLATMDVFVKEVSLDWTQWAERQKHEGMEPEDAEADDMTWYPKQKVQSAMRKLKGDNPCYITRDEIRLGHSKNAALKAFETVVLGDKRDNVRARLPDRGLTEEQQVSALIDQAMDPNILGRTWSGWEPWM
ncbi:DNA-dependent protein kinase catalytic subunit-like [Babylonia areolata]|uniref:DNA-dependent protein kinase catalytic subunit-like n=1 Tax=Babylonia areolata TaxID=304850 RepID=UPI003FD3C34C